MFENLMKVADLRAYSRRANVRVKLTSVGEPKTVVSRRDGNTYRVAEAVVGDETGCIVLNLWNEDIDRFEVGDVIEIKNGYMKTFRGSMRLNIGKYGEAQKTEEDIPEVNLKNNLSEASSTY
jgi:replication factor A1